MRRQLSLVFLPLLYAPISLANEAAWNCEQNKDSTEWVCTGDEKPATATSSTATQAPKSSVQPLPVKRIPPAQAQPSEHAVQPAVPTTVRRTAPSYAPVVTESTRPVVPPAPQPAKPPVAPVVAREQPPVKMQPAPPVQTMPAPAILKNAPAETVAKEEDEEKAEQEEKADNSSTSMPIHTPSSNSDTQASSVTTKNSGWNCDSKNQEENWNCELVGTDPKGQARPVRVVDSNTHSFSLLDPAFSPGQEQTFETLTAQLPYDPWEVCASKDKKDKPTFVAKKGLRETSPLELTSDFAQIFDNEIGNYLGNVEISRADQHSLSHIANYDKVSGALDLNGDVYYKEDELALYGHSASIKLNSDQAKLRDAQFIAPTGHLRGSSKVVYRDSKTFSRYKGVTYTSCAPGNQDWALHADELKLNDDTGRGAVKSAWLEFKGVPVFYTPYMSFPKDSRRTTGFLTPSFHFTKQAGFGLYTPYYWNIAPNYDATFTPRYLTKRGMLLGGDFRYLTEMTKGDVKLEYMPNDSQLHRSRYLGAITNNTVFSPNISSNVDANYVSDKNYFSQLGNTMSLPNFSFLKSHGDINYVREGVSLTAAVDNYQSVDPNTVILPYRRLPQVNLNLNHSFKSVPMDAAMESESVYFQHGDLVNGERLNAKPSVSFPLQTASAFVTPKLSLQHTEYFLSKTNNIALPGNISRTLPIFSLDSGLFFEKDMNVGGSPMLHTLEPRLFYLYVPYKNQNNIPLFDTAQYDFVFNSLFRENRFSGTDRIQDANQLSVALTSRLVDSNSGREKLKLNIGDIFYFKDRNVTLDPLLFPKETSWSSPLVAEASSELTDHVSVESGLQWDPHFSDITRGKGAIHYINQPGEIINAGYYYRKNPQIPDRADDIIQSDVSVHWPIYDDWSVVGRWQYSLLYDKTQEGFFGVEKENCCWRFRIIGRHYMNSIANTTGVVAPGFNQQFAQGQAQNGIFFQLELKGLTGIGERLDTFFEKNIYGYRKSER